MDPEQLEPMLAEAIEGLWAETPVDEAAVAELERLRDDLPHRRRKLEILRKIQRLAMAGAFGMAPPEVALDTPVDELLALIEQHRPTVIAQEVAELHRISGGGVPPPAVTKDSTWADVDHYRSLIELDQLCARVFGQSLPPSIS